MIYSYEQENPQLDEASEQALRANNSAWTFFQAQAAWYQKAAIWWVISAKRDDTKQKRLAALIADFGAGAEIRSSQPLFKVSAVPIQNRDNRGRV